MSSASSPTKTASSASSVPSCSSKTTNTSSSTATCRSRAWQRSQRQPSRRLSRYRLHPRPPENAARWPQPNLHHIDGHDQKWTLKRVQGDDVASVGPSTTLRLSDVSGSSGGSLKEAAVLQTTPLQT